ncbi:Protein of unknown function (DUF2892) [Halohasta litchfieldiae]|jgi:hypothetical protein|uniref:Inner membrane protein YgaP-like transmembrane domain-containing protein n=1 Tax=Halohasta litchfieldiae TaxID=1073996 RepID=A0A1H6XRR8_9EURY|nr:DUF2892 domain-containing protein [Halohasta litchfieldiae]ATW86852.1 Protein of unknown function (DUF2892) [Halohasta litchfieldiae]SEJ31768.1 Protein of unknown function [Halohasta litchfieldiae]
MIPEQNVGGTDRLLRAAFAVVFTVLAVTAIRKRNYYLLLSAGLGAIGLGFNAVTCFCGLNEALGIDTTEE